MAIKIENLQYLQIGVQGENAANYIEFDMSSWVEQFPGAAFHLLFKPYNSLDIFPMVTEYNAETHIMTWTPTLPATATPGVGYAEIRAMYDEGGMLKKSRIIPTTVENSVSGVDGGTVPLPYQDWVNLTLSYKTGAETARDEAVAAGNSATSAKDDAVSAKNAAVSAKDDAVAAKNDAVSAKDDAVSAKNDAVSAKNAAISAKEDAVDAKVTAVLAKEDALSGAANAELESGKAQEWAEEAHDWAISAAGSASDAIDAQGGAIDAKNAAVDAKTAAEAAAQSASGKADKSNTVLDTTLSRGRKENTTTGTASFAFGYNVTSSNDYSFAIGYTTTASGKKTFAEGTQTTASGESSHAEGNNSTASGKYAHSEGNGSTASGFASHAEGGYTTASGSNSCSQGIMTLASGNASHVFGMYNIEDSISNIPSWVSGTSYKVGDRVKRTASGSTKYYMCKTANSDASFTASRWIQNSDTDMAYVEIVGNGVEASQRSNARTLDWQGNEWVAGNVTAGGGSLTLGSGNSAVTITAEQLQSLLNTLN